MNPMALFSLLLGLKRGQPGGNSQMMAQPNTTKPWDFTGNSGSRVIGPNPGNYGDEEIKAKRIDRPRLAKVIPYRDKVMAKQEYAVIPARMN